MTQAADIIRDKRRHFAAPGGSHDRLVAVLGKALPAGIGVIAAIMILTPLGPRGEISFLLDRNRVAITGERIRLDRAVYRGQDNQKRAFTVTAGSAVQASSRLPIVEMQALDARIQLADGPASLTAGSGRYNFDLQQIAVSGPVNFRAADGYSMVTNNVDIDLKARRASGSGGVSGAVPSGTFTADRIIADLGERTVTLEGNARLRMEPGKLRLPR